MKLTCDACKLTLNAKDEDRGKSFTCPICRGPLHEVGAAPAKPADGEQPKKPATPALEWAGGSLDDLLYMVNSQALAAVIEVNAPDKKGEVHVIAGGIDEAFHNGAKGDDALVQLRKYDSSRFRVELRLPSDAGSMASPNPDRGDLKQRPLAKLMRYCEEYVLTCDLEAWRGNETCRVEYRRGNIARTLINGIDAPEQLADVMGWTSGNYRFVLPRLALPAELDSASRAQAKAAAETRISEQKAARKTMFGMPAAQMFPNGIPPAAGSQPPASQAAAPPPAAPAQPSAQKTMFMGSAAPAPNAPTPPVQQPAAAAQQAPAKTMLGMPVMAQPQPQASASPAGGPASVVIDQAYAAASAPAKPAEPAPQELGVTARGYSPVGNQAPKKEEKELNKAKTQPPESKKRERDEDAEEKKGKEKRSVEKTASARKPAAAAEKAAGSPWMNVGIAVGVAAVIVVVWLLVSYFSK